MLMLKDTHIILIFIIGSPLQKLYMSCLHIFTLCQVAVILVWASISSAVLGTFIGLAVAFTSLSLGVGVAGAGVAVIVTVMVISHRMFRHQGSRGRAGYTRLEGSDCACSPSMTDIFHQCDHVTGRRGGATGYQSLYQ